MRHNVAVSGNRKYDFLHAMMAGYMTSYGDLTWPGGRIWTRERERERERERDENFNFKIGRERDNFLYLGLVLAV